MLQKIRPVILGEAPKTGHEPLEGRSQGLAVKMIVPDSIPNGENDIPNDESHGHRRRNKDDQSDNDAKDQDNQPYQHGHDADYDLENGAEQE